MTARRIVVETPCDFCSPLRHHVERRVLSEGEYVLVEKVDGEWPEWALCAVGFDQGKGSVAREILDDLVLALTQEPT